MFGFKMEFKLTFLLLFILYYVGEGLQVCQDKATVSYCSEQCHLNIGDDWKIANCMKTCGYCTSENIALGKETIQSSIYTGEGRKNSLSSNAVDGNTDSVYSRGSCTHTGNQIDPPWWCVNLQSTQQFQSIILYNRQTNQKRLEGFSIKVSETGECDQRTFESSQVCYKDRSSSPQDIYTVDKCNITEGQSIFITVPTGIVSLCEVEILQAKCTDGYYSTGKTCRECNCNGAKCNIQTGDCDECNENCINQKCDDLNRCSSGCKEGFYGEYCKQPCNSNCNGNKCDDNGNCNDGCIDGFHGPMCDQICPVNCKESKCYINGTCIGCNTGHYGDICGQSCRGCIDDQCDTGNGECLNDGCKEGYWGEDRRCNTPCSIHCLHSKCINTNGYCNNGCETGFYSSNCISTCNTRCQNGCNQDKGHCTSCNEGRYGNFCGKLCSYKCSRGCDQTSGICNHCMMGYYGDYCNITCSEGCTTRECNPNGSCKCNDMYYGTQCTDKCSINCLDRRCGISQSGLTCTTDCIDGYKGSYCQDTCLDNCTSCNRYNNQCTSCKTGWYGDTCQTKCNSNCISGCDQATGRCTSCKTGWYGDQCQIKCNSNCINRCDQATGRCDDCKVGRFGDTCSEVCSTGCLSHGTDIYCSRNGQCDYCIEGRFGSQCNMICNGNCNGGCNKENGRCINCKTGYYGNTCDQNCTQNCKECGRSDGFCKSCIEGYYGNNCDKNCSKNCKGGCNMMSGKCNTCLNGFYGDNCNNNCSKNCNGGCNREWGSCTDCMLGYFGSRCEEQCSLNCEGGCIKSNGNCYQCKVGFYSYKCDKNCNINCKGSCSQSYGNCKNCINGFYGKQCQLNCPKGCLKSGCSRNEGKCSDGCVKGKRGRTCSIDCKQNCMSCDQFDYYKCTECQDGWYESNCNTRCPSNCIKCNQQTGDCLKCSKPWYGDNCNKQCLQCLNGICNINGTCINGCINGTHGDLCQYNCSYNCKQPDSGNDICDQKTGKCTKGCQAGYQGHNCTEECTQRSFGESCLHSCGFCKEERPCDIITGSCGLTGCLDGYIGLTCHEILATTNLLPILYVLIVLILIGIIIVIAVYKWRKKRNVTKGGRQELVNIEVEAHRENENEAVYQNSGESSTSPTLIRLTNLWTKIEACKVDSTLFEQFQKLPSGLCAPHSIALSAENKSKNRYKMICAYDDTRVKLNIENDDPSTDYINACYIAGFSTDKPKYIASQGPTPVNIVEFWRMIWDVETGKIVMLTNLTEMGVVKCTLYWPLLGDDIKYGKITIATIREDILANFTVRTFRLTKANSSRMIKQYHYVSWPDKSVPNDISSLVEFRDKVVRSNTVFPGPMIVHCSAGVGRTGTFVALDYLISEGEANKAVDVFNCIHRMRNERVNMVQTKDQYVFIHEALLNWYISYNVTTSVVGYQSTYQELLQKSTATIKCKLVHVFKLLSAYSPKQNERDCTTALQDENKDKNRSLEILASDKYRPYLLTAVPNSTDYINAVYLPSYFEKHGYILTQTPLETTVIDFIRLLYDTNTSVIVDLDYNLTHNQSIGQYLPDDKKTLKHGPFQLSRQIEDIESDLFTFSKLTLTYTQDEGEEEIVIYHYQCHFWPKDSTIPENSSPLFTLITNINSRKIAFCKDEYRPILIHCYDGASRSGLFCVLAAMLERLIAEQSVNVFQVITQFRIIRPQIITNYIQFKFCFDAIGRYLDHFADYANSC